MVQVQVGGFSFQKNLDVNNMSITGSLGVIPEMKEKRGDHNCCVSIGGLGHEKLGAYCISRRQTYS